MTKKYFATALARVTLPVIAKKPRKAYQPVYLAGREVSKGERGEESHQRWEQIEKVIDARGVKSVTDLGCAEGFFVRKCAEKGCFVTGVEGDPRMLLWAQTTLTLDGLDHFGFIKMNMTVESLDHVPAADMTIFLSVLHHVIRAKGEEYGLEFLKKVKSLTKKVMIFEMGQSDEGHGWAKLMPAAMVKDPHQWIKDFLLKAGFKEVQELAQVDAFNAKIKRILLAAYV